FGVAVVEAMAHGVPVVVTPGVATGEHVRESGCGIVAEDSVEGVAAAIRDVLLADRRELGRRGREYVAKHLTWPIIAEKVEEMYFNAWNRIDSVKA
ncbi:MAG: glycosyltransferase, partial [Bryobacteraceae bacterium]